MNSRSRQRGAAALVVALVLLFGMTIVAFFANRTMIFEQRTSANQYRYTKAFELADAGIEWATARLNDPLTLTAANSCAPSSGAGLASFRERYILPSAADAAHSTAWFNPLTAVAFPGCEIDPASGQLACNCPTTGAVAFATTTQPRFRVQFKPTVSSPADGLAVEIVSRGCTAGDPCDPNQSVSSGTDGTAIARVLVKLRPTLPSVPNAALISASITLTSGTLRVVPDAASDGIAVQTGGAAPTSSNFDVRTVPGAPQAVLDNDTALSTLINADANGELFFASYFGAGFSDFQGNLATKAITAGASFNAASAPNTCSSDTDCGTAVSYWADRGFTQFWVAPNVTFNSTNMPITTGTLGSAARPLILATAGQLAMTGGITAYGVYYGGTVAAGGNFTLVGSVISRGAFAKTGGGTTSTLVFKSVFGSKEKPAGLLVPVPGSWRDKLNAY
jgi:PilX N-terminal